MSVLEWDICLMSHANSRETSVTSNNTNNDTQYDHTSHVNESTVYSCRNRNNEEGKTLKPVEAVCSSLQAQLQQYVTVRWILLTQNIQLHFRTQQFQLMGWIDREAPNGQKTVNPSRNAQEKRKREVCVNGNGSEWSEVVD
eukprot:TRINITY_DN10476_c0_g1::TRINITY_DN10476_c0_g1_i1::g.15307::m.15307 TRINITY_DN10476_c0_g1::TRINITY_DN10476_c0_g1_i1::g.15307  ORF type:complete len:141 (-),score=-3.76,Lys/PF00062.15/0.027 TRINITY_DN10476_c0_g1_i1:19-441(-)